MHLINQGHFATFVLVSFCKHIIQCARAEAIDILSDESLRSGNISVRSVIEEIYVSSYKLSFMISKNL